MHHTSKTILLIIVVVCQAILAGCSLLQAEEEGAETGGVQAGPVWQTATVATKPASPTKTRPTRTPTITRTPTPTLAAHEWTPDEVLVRFIGEDTMWRSFNPSYLPPNLTLFANGQLFLYHEETRQLLAGQLSDESICELLYTIERNGFFDLDPAAYSFSRPAATARPPIYRVEIHAWRSNTLEVYGGSEGTRPGLPANIRNILRALSAVRLEGLTIYQPERLGVWFSEYIRPRPDNLRWPLIAPKLADLSMRSLFYKPLARPSLILEGEQALKMFQVFDQSVSGMGEAVEEDGTIYQVLARPLLPDEFSTKPVAKPDFFRCRSTDGELEIPKHTLAPVVIPTDIPLYESFRRATPTQKAPPTPLPTYTPGPTLTSTPMPALSAHGWVPKEKLVFYDYRGGDGSCTSAFFPPKLTLYADGQLF